MELQSIAELADRIREQVHRAIVGQDDVIDLVLTALLAGGHVLLEGVPGTAKTLLARCFAQSLSLECRRIQFTPDLMPSDVIGTNLFDFRENAFKLTRGPVFTELLIADEINRTPPKTQAALLEAMQERAVTIDGTTHTLGDGFLVIATQNPLEHEGTYPLPEAQLDRFLFKVSVEYPNRDEERALVVRHGHRASNATPEALGIEPVAALQDIVAARRAVSEIRLSDDVVDYVVDLVRETRRHTSLLAGASPRAASMLARAVRSYAALDGRDYVVPDDVKYLAPYALGHRLVRSPRAEIDNLASIDIVRQLLDQVAAPR